MLSRVEASSEELVSYINNLQEEAAPLSLATLQYLTSSLPPHEQVKLLCYHNASLPLGVVALCLYPDFGKFQIPMWSLDKQSTIYPSS